MSTYSNLIENAENLMNDFETLTEFEALQIAVKLSAIESIENIAGFDSQSPSFVQMIANGSHLKNTADALQEIAHALDTLSQDLNTKL